MARPLPGLDVHVINSTGQMNQAWFEYFQSLASIVKALGIAPSSFAVSPITPGSTSVSVTTGAITDASPIPGTIRTYLYYGAAATPANIQDNFTTIVDYIQKIRVDLTADQTVVGALNTRVTALENKINAVISDLAARFP